MQMGSKVKQTWVQMLTRPPVSYLNVDKSFNFPEPYLPQLQCVVEEEMR